MIWPGKLRVLVRGLAGALVAAGLLACSCLVCAEPERAVQKHLRDILAQPEYNRSFGQNPVQLFWMKVWEWVADLLGRLSRLSFGGGTAGRIASIVFACLVVLGFVVLLVLVIRRLSYLRRRALAEDALQSESAYGLPSARPLIKQAAKLAEAGDYRGAFRAAYLASISSLDEARLLRFERGRTNWEYLRELDHGGHTVPRDQLRPLTIDFDRKFYGREDCVRDDYERALATFNTISAGLEQSA